MAGEEISIADLSIVCELEQLRLLVGAAEVCKALILMT